MDPAEQRISSVTSNSELPSAGAAAEQRGAGDKLLNKALSFLFERQEELLGEAIRQCQDLLDLARVQVAEIAVCIDDE